MSNKLYLVPTPIGNLEDISYRAVKTLQQVELILAEDTRKSGILLKRYQVTTKMESFHKFNEHQKLSHYIEFLQSGNSIALITDAGTPAISDPGFLLVRECLRKEMDVE